MLVAHEVPLTYMEENKTNTLCVLFRVEKTHARTHTRTRTRTYTQTHARTHTHMQAHAGT